MLGSLAMSHPPPLAIAFTLTLAARILDKWAHFSFLFVRNLVAHSFFPFFLSKFTVTIHSVVVAHSNSYCLHCSAGTAIFLHLSSVCARTNFFLFLFFLQIQIFFSMVSRTFFRLLLFCVCSNVSACESCSYAQRLTLCHSFKYPNEAVVLLLIGLFAFLF